MIYLAAVPESNRQYGYSWMRASVRGRHNAERAGLGPRDELTRYLESPLEEVDNVVAWWGVSDQNPTILSGSNCVAAPHHTVSNSF